MPNAEKLILISIDDFEIKVALLEAGKLVEYYVEDLEDREVVGNIYLGRVKDVLPGMQAAFVDIGMERNAYLFVDEVLVPEDDLEPNSNKSPQIQHLLHPGQELMVQVTRNAYGAKGARTSAQLALPGRKLVLMPYARTLGVSKRLSQSERERLHKICEAIKPHNMGLIVRTAAENAGPAELKKDLDYLLKLWYAITRRAQKYKPPAVIYNELDLASKVVRNIFDDSFDKLIIDSEIKYQDILNLVKKTAPKLRKKIKYYKLATPLMEKYEVSKQIESALRRKVWLRSGGYIAIDKTEALTSIDVNTAKFIGSHSLEQTILKTNLEAAHEIVNQLRLRDIGGIIVIDFIDMKSPRHRETVYRAFNEALNSDRAKSRVIEISKMGLVEMTRKKISAGIQAHYFEKCSCCGGEGLVVSRRRARVDVVKKIKAAVVKSRVKALAFKIAAPVYEDIKEDGGKRLRQIRRQSGKQIYLCPDGEIDLQSVELLKKGKAEIVEKFASGFSEILKV